MLHGRLQLALILLRLAAQGIDVNARSGMGGETALAGAAGAGQAGAVRWLLQRGADAGLCDDRHASPLDKARRSGHAACAQASPGMFSVADAVTYRQVMVTDGSALSQN